MESNLTEKIINKITEDKLNPKPRWGFLLKNYLFWFVFGLSSIIGGFAVSVILHIAKSFYSLTGSGWVYFPLFWIVFLSIFSLIAFLNVKHTRKAYKINPFLWVLISIFVSFVIGGGIYSFGLADNFEEQCYHHLPGYGHMVNKGFNRCTNLEKGILCGAITSIEKTSFALESGNGIVWKVTTNIIPHEHLGHRVQLKGKVVGELQFAADEITMLSCCEACSSGQMCERKIHK